MTYPQKYFRHRIAVLFKQAADVVDLVLYSLVVDPAV
jgi:hypothetical protein